MYRALIKPILEYEQQTTSPFLGRDSKQRKIIQRLTTCRVKDMRNGRMKSSFLWRKVVSSPRLPMPLNKLAIHIVSASTLDISKPLMDIAWPSSRHNLL